MKRVLSIVVLLLLAAGCGEADISDAVDDFARRAVANGDIYSELSVDERLCVEQEELERVDFGSAIKDAGVEGDAARTTAVEITLECVEDPLEWVGWVELIGTNMSTSIGNGVTFDYEESRCVVAGILDQSTDPARMLAVGDQPSDQEVLFSVFEECLDPDNYGRVTGQVTDFNGYGDDPRLDGIQDDCTASDDRACDLLWFNSSAGSDYEAYADTCGGRGSQASGWCTELDFSSSLTVSENDPAMLELMADCDGGDATACDLAFLAAPIGSPTESQAHSCGGRFPLGREIDCRTSMAE